MNQNKIKNFFNEGDKYVKNENPFIKKKIPNSQDFEIKNQNDESLEKFYNFNPFTQQISNPILNLTKNFSKNTPLNEAKDRNSQKKFLNNIDTDITPENNFQKKSIYDFSVNNIDILNKKNNLNYNQNEKLDFSNFSNIKLDENLNEQDIIKKSDNPFLLNTSNNIFNNFENTSLINSKLMQSFEKEEEKNKNLYENNNKNDTMIVLGTKILDNDTNKSNILPLYDRHTNELNINNLNEMIQISENHIENNSKRKEIIQNSINSNLDIIKEEQNESDKKSEKDFEFNSSISNIKNKLLNSIGIDNEFISIEKLINNENDNKEIEKAINDNYEHINSSLNNYNYNIIDSLVNTDINIFKNNISEFINYSKGKIENLKILDNICDKIKEEIIDSYKIMEKIERNNIKEYEKLNEYQEKLDYIIDIQNKLIEELTASNIQLKSNINKVKNKKEDPFIDDNELNKNIFNTNSNLDKLAKIINDKFSDNQKSLDDNKLKINELNNINENSNFFEVVKNITNDIKEISDEYLKILLKISDIKNNIK